MLYVLVLIILLARVDAAGNTVNCPTGCSCEIPSSYSHMHVDCGRGHANKEHLSLELDSVLSADHFVEHLTSLSIINSPLTRVPASVCKLVNLTSLNLDNNKLTELPDNCFTNLTKLVTLSMNSNSIVGLQDGLFDGLQSLATLNLSYNHIAFIGLRVFSNSSDLTSLRTINLADNRLTSLEPWPYYRLILGNKTSRVTIDLRSNLISNFTNKLKFEFRCGMKLPYGFLRLGYNRIKHVMDLINGWNIGVGQFYSAAICLANRQHCDKAESISNFFYWKTRLRLYRLSDFQISEIYHRIRCTGGRTL